MRALFFLIVLAGTMAFLLAERAQTDEAARANAGLYQANCASCHAEDGSGDTVVGRQLGLPDLRSDDVQSKTDPELSEAVAAVAAHSAFRRRSGDDGVARVLAHVRTLGDAPGGERQ